MGELSGFKRISRAVLLAGTFDVGLHYKHEWRRGVEGVSCLGLVHGVSGGTSPKTVCSLQLARTTSAESIASLVPILVLHGDCDDVVPETHSELLVLALQAKGAKAECRIIPRLDHYMLCFELAWSSRSPVLLELRRFLN